MPSLKTYTPYETLAFCQSVAHHGSDDTAFEDIAAALNSNQLIRESEAYDQTRLTAAALQGLYQDVLVEEKHGDAALVNGDGANPKKRKLSTSPAPSDGDESSQQKLLQSVVDKLYARFRQQTIEEIRQEEEAYGKLQAEIADLEKQAEAEQERAQESVEGTSIKVSSPVELPKPTEDSTPTPPAASTSPKSTTAPSGAGVDASNVEPPASSAAPSTPSDKKESPSATRSAQPVIAPLSPAPTTPRASSAKPSADPAQARSSQPPPGHSQHPSPGAYPRNLPVPSPQRPNYAPINPQHFQPGPQGQPMPVLQPLAGVPHMPPPAEYPQKRASPSAGQGRGSPIPMQPQQPYPAYPGYHQPPWPHHVPPQHQYPQPPPYGSPPYYMQSPPGRPPMPYQTPHHPPYQPYPQSAPIHYQGQPPPPHGWHQPPSQQYYGFHGSANVTPMPRSDSRPLQPRARSSTPWKRRSLPTAGARQPSPVRPERDVSPLTDTESPSRSRSSKARTSPGKKERKIDDTLTGTRETPSARGRQGASATPSAFEESRSQSIGSFVSDTPTDRRKRGTGAGQQIKAEPPSTPIPMLSDTEQTQRSTRPRGRPRKQSRPRNHSARPRGRPRKDAVASKNEGQGPTTTAKRKRSPERDSASPPPPSPVRTPLHPQPSHDPAFVIVSRNFAKTAHLLLNDIVSHKLAGIFAKPLSERDAPGYKDLVLRPQDLKSIKAAISKGGKAALAAIEALEEDDKTVEETPTRSGPTPGTEAREGPVGNGTYLVKLSEDLVPPRGIVTSSQLEMELVRMFANAVMFNPLPPSERGFGRSLRLRKRGGDVNPDGTTADAASSEEGSPVDEGGIISDTREMFDDVLRLVRKWREVEIERLGGGNAEDNAADSVLEPPKASASTNMTHTRGSATASANASARHSSADADDDETAELGASTPVPPSSVGIGPGRKRRRIAEN